MKGLFMDLSLKCPAFCVAEVVAGKLKIHHLSHIVTDKNKTHPYRLFQIYKHMEKILEEHPDIEVMVREKAFAHYTRETQAIFKVIGVSDVFAKKHGFDTVVEIAPTTVKKLVTGNGRSTKADVATALSTNFDINIDFKTDDESDAVAVAIAYFKQEKVLP
jgi:crossover junction endodeoxyribonuclease RuvC